jgi:ketosteroid isomerase-like protein
MTGLQTFNPSEFPAVFKANFDAGLIEAIVAGYGVDGVLDLGVGNVFRGRDRIRLAIANLLAPGPPINVTPRQTLATGDHAVVLFDGLISGNAPDGAPVEMGGAAVDVLRREGDGVWRQILDLPFGHATPTA